MPTLLQRFARLLPYVRHSRAGLLEVQATLPAGSYLTSLLGHFVNAQEAPQGDLR